MTLRFLFIWLALARSVDAQPVPPSSSDARAGQHALEGYAWPAGLKFHVADTCTDSPTTLSSIQQTRGEAARSGAPGSRSITPPSPGPATLAQAAQLERLQQRAAELTRQLREVRAAGLDLAKLARAKDNSALRPVLLFLAEQGVMSRDEVESALANFDLDELLVRIADRARHLKAEQDRQQVLIYLKEAGVNSPAGAGR
jgi:hypothetical protein